ncbi:MAG TPA: hypothetical protein VGL81_32130 [Polyangiaceae bacterium]|jgi:hypothetical protein
MLRSSRALLWSLTVCGAFVGGVAFEHFGRDANAQSAGISTLYVPAGGLVFRAMDGKPLARISEDSHGGALELFDDRREVAARFQGSRPPPLARQNPYTLDDRDPWVVSAPAEPSPGF